MSRRKNKFRRERRAKKPGLYEFFHELFIEGLNGYMPRPVCFGLGKDKTTMNIPVVQEDGTENEFELEMCCVECVARLYGWSATQFDKISKMSEPVKVPDNITTAEEFKQFIKTL